jgi:hypothetical protein
MLFEEVLQTLDLIAHSLSVRKGGNKSGFKIVSIRHMSTQGKNNALAISCGTAN